MRCRTAGVASVLAAAALGWLASPAGAQTQDTIRHYEKREKAASPEAKRQLEAQRQYVQSKKLGFRVGHTGVADSQLERITGLRRPTDLPEQMKKQNAVAREKLGAMPLRRAPSLCSSGDPSFDWRKANGSTAVRNQGLCGSCWAFGTHAVLEGHYRVGADRTVDSAEQETLDCNNLQYDCDGGWWAYDHLVQPGTAEESAYPYVAERRSCRTSVARPLGAAAWGYVGEEASVPGTAALKQALCEHGPLAVGVLATDVFKYYAGGVFDDCAAAPGDINHAVTVIGWDDGKQAWLIKNSWGKDWGETGDSCSGCDCPNSRGYMWIRYGCANVGLGASWAVSR